MALIFSIFRYLNSKSLNIEIHYSHLYFRDENGERLECGFVGDALKSLNIEMMRIIFHLQ